MQQVWRERSSSAKLQKCFLSQVRHLQKSVPILWKLNGNYATNSNLPSEMKYIIPFQIHNIFFQDMKHVGGDEDIC